jgi:hypothetical protein
MTPDLVSRADVERLIKRICEMTAIAHSDGNRERKYLHDELLSHLSQLPSVIATSGEAVSWESRERNSSALGWSGWAKCLKRTYDRYRMANEGARIQVRALCVISDTPPGEK